VPLSGARSSRSRRLPRRRGIIRRELLEARLSIWAFSASSCARTPPRSPRLTFEPLEAAEDCEGTCPLISFAETRGGGVFRRGPPRTGRPRRLEQHLLAQPIPFNFSVLPSTGLGVGHLTRATSPAIGALSKARRAWPKARILFSCRAPSSRGIHPPSPSLSPHRGRGGEPPRWIGKGEETG